jgi:hypothetical protein
MDFEALVVIGGAVLAIGAALSTVALLLSRRIVRRARSSTHIRVTRLGFCFGVAQALVTFSVVGWGFLHPDTFVGRIVAYHGGVVAIIVIVGIACCAISWFSQRNGLVLYFRSQGGG